MAEVFLKNFPRPNDHQEIVYDRQSNKVVNHFDWQKYTIIIIIFKHMLHTYVSQMLHTKNSCFMFS